jgi:hypothetical protein
VVRINDLSFVYLASGTHAGQQVCKRQRVWLPERAGQPQMTPNADAYLPIELPGTEWVAVLAGLSEDDRVLVDKGLAVERTPDSRGGHLFYTTAMAFPKKQLYVSPPAATHPSMSAATATQAANVLGDVHQGTPGRDRRYGLEAIAQECGNSIALSAIAWVVLHPSFPALGTSKGRDVRDR